MTTEGVWISLLPDLPGIVLFFRIRNGALPESGNASFLQMKKAIYFFQYLPPWKIDVFNEIAMHFDLTVAFFDIEREGFTYDRKDLFGRLRAVKVEVLSKGFSIKNHPVRFGVAN